MTEEYKKNLIDYVTGNIQEGTPTTDEIIKEIVELNRSDWVDYIPTTWQNIHVEGIINSNTGDVNIIYGGYYTDNMLNSKGFIIIVDNNFKPIKYIDSFDSGTPLNYIQCMKQAEDNSFYFVDDTAFPYNNTIGPGYLTNGQRRFVMVNNFTLKINDDYKVILRTSYNFSKSYSGTAIDTQLNNIYVKNMEKDPNSSNYIFIGKRYNTKASYVGFNLVHAIQLKINVGSANEWNHWTFIDDRCWYGGSFITFDNEGNPFFRILGTYDSFNNYGIYQLTKNYTSSTTTNSVIYRNNDYLDDQIPTQHYENQCIFLTPDNVYFVVTNQLYSLSGGVENKHIAFYNYNFSNSTLTQIYEKYLGTNPSSSRVWIEKDEIFLAKNQGKLYIHYIENFDRDTYKADYYIQRYEGEWNPKLISLNSNCVLQQRGLYVENNYNIIKIFCTPLNFRNPTWYFPAIKEIYNPTQYNGEPYESKDSLCPLYANLYSTGSLVFSRNLYNISKQNNMSMSSVEIPNSYLNDATITQNDLISETNVELVNDPTQWTKNIYEVVDLNFLNTIRVIDEDTNTEYLESAIKVNNATTDGGDTNYQNTPCNKYRINYSDNTTSIGALVWNSINNYNKKTQITFYVDKEINSIDLISNDETTIYLTIPIEATIGSYYTINQKVRTGDKPTPVQLQYNNEDINYQNQPVMVYVEE